MDLLELLIVDLLSEKRISRLSWNKFRRFVASTAYRWIPIAGRTRSKVVNGAPTINALSVLNSSFALFSLIVGAV